MEREVEVLFMQNMLVAVEAITDTFAQTGKPLTDKWIEMLDYIFKEIDFDIEGFSDGNDCGCCKTWKEYVEQRRLLMLTGEILNNGIKKIDIYDWLTGKIIEPTEKED